MSQSLTCTALWKEGSILYFAGRLQEEGSSSTDWQRILRCFVYRPTHGGYAVAVSGSAQCHLHSAEEGHRTLQLYTEQGEQQRECHLPRWMVESSWSSLHLPHSSLQVSQGGLLLLLLLPPGEGGWPNIGGWREEPGVLEERGSRGSHGDSHLGVQAAGALVSRRRSNDD